MAGHPEETCRGRKAEWQLSQAMPRRFTSTGRLNGSWGMPFEEDFGMQEVQW